MKYMNKDALNPETIYYVLIQFIIFESSFI
jgi:hypothetical protein